MKKMFITTVVGSVTPGVIKALANLTREAGGEWLTSKVIKIDNLFAAMMKVAIEDESVESLKQQFAVQFPTLQFSYGAKGEVYNEHTRTMQLNVDCSDRPGLTREIVDLLSNLNLEIEHMEFNRMHVSTIGQTVFSSKLAIAVPDEVSNESVVELLEGVSKDARVSMV
ncbi:transcriptional regulator [Shewanella mesophila]|uniref:ACT domain-containing protein n=1 Tax=Shewanella mesophila TaxID=2864208 RepID=UPI001C65A745|nr:ACT domain-containing protein [Shewanella mesophila]QYJ87101.1 transcriptional regulator [Shewanella mesophila]